MHDVVEMTAGPAAVILLHVLLPFVASGMRLHRPPRIDLVVTRMGEPGFVRLQFARFILP